MQYHKLDHKNLIQWNYTKFQKNHDFQSEQFLSFRSRVVRWQMIIKQVKTSSPALPLEEKNGDAAFFS